MVDSLGPDEKLCPFCAETIKQAAVRCRYCQSDLPAAVVNDPAPVELVEPRDPSSVELVETTDPSSVELVETTDLGDVPLHRASRLASGRLLVVLLLLCLVLAAATATTWLLSERKDESAAGAVSSTQARDEGIQQADKLTQKVLSYDWSSLDADIKSNEALLAPSFRSDYAKTMSGVRDQTIKNQVTLKADVVASSVVSATADKVVALVFVNQVTTAKGTTNRRVDQNRVLVTLTRLGGEWRVSKMDAF